MLLTVIEVLSNGYNELPFVQIPDPCFIPNNNSALHEEMNLSGELSKRY